MRMTYVTVVGAGLAGSEAAWQLSKRGFHVNLYEMRPVKSSPAHHTGLFAELVCSNSLRSDRTENAVGLLKEEMRRLDSLIMSCADETRVPAGGALAVDRTAFSELITEKIKTNPNISVLEEECVTIPDGPCIIATGPLTEGALYNKIEVLTGKSLHFYDAAAPIVYKDSLNFDKIYAASRYGRGEDYLNCPMDRDSYFHFISELKNAERATLHEFETPRVFEGCMPVEIMADRGDMTLAFGPMKPVGLEINGKTPFAVVQLRQDDSDGTMYNIVGFQTNLKFAEQRRVFGLIPGLEHAEYARYGVMHRNTFLPSPGFLHWDYSVISRPDLYFAGQMTGVEGYVESAASGLLASISLARKLSGAEPVDFSNITAIGALGHYVSEYIGDDFQPMNITFGIMAPTEKRIKNKMQKAEYIRDRSLNLLNNKIIELAQ